MTEEQRLKIADEGGYTRDAIKQTIKDDYFRTLRKNKGSVNQTLIDLSIKYGRSESGIRHIVSSR